MKFDSRDSFIKHRILLQGQELRLTEIVDKQLKELKKELLIAIRERKGNNIRALQSKIESIVNQNYGLIEEKYLSDLKELLEYEAEYQENWLNKSAEQEKKGSLIKTAATTGLIALLLKGKSKKLGNAEIAKVIKEKIAKGQTLNEAFVSQRTQLSVILKRVTTDAVVNNLSDEVFERNLAAAIGRNVGQTKNVLRTFVNAHSNNVAAETFIKNGIKEYEYVAILDSATTELCESENGNIYKFGEGPIPPLHYNCRSTIRPVVDEEIGDLKGFLERNPDTRIKTDEKGNFKKSEDFNISLNKMKKEDI